MTRFLSIGLSLLVFDLFALGALYWSLPDVADLRTDQKFSRPDATGKKWLEIDPSSAQFIPLESIPDSLVQAVLMLEDDRFFSHRGFDFKELKNAVQEHREGSGRLRGASTLTQQLAKNLYLSPDRSWIRKSREALIAMKMELVLPKERILELYLNSIDWGQNKIGIRSAAQYYFGKSPKELSLKESVYLASIIPNPVRWGLRPPPPHIQKRMHTTLERLYRYQLIRFEDYHLAMQEKLFADSSIDEALLNSELSE